MRSAPSWLLLVVSLALAGGLSAFLLATPHESGRPNGDSLGFRTLDKGAVLADLAHAEAYHRARQRDAQRLASARRNAAAWLRTLADSRGRRGAGPTGIVATKHASVTAFVRWADELPRSQWTVAIAAVEARDVPTAEGDTDVEYVATGHVELAVMSAAERVRRQRVPVELVLGTGHEPGFEGMPTRWVVQRVTTRGSRSFVRAYGDPLVLRRTNLDVIAPAVERALATRLADDAARQLPALVARWRSVAGSGVASIWVLENSGRSRAVLGSVAPADTLAAGSSGSHGAVWVERGGDIAVDASRMRRLTPAQQLEALRHAIAHVATRGLRDDAPAVFAEGIASFEARRIAAPSEPLDGIDLAPLVAAFGSAQSGLAGLLVASSGLPLDTGATSTDQLAALATIAWIEAEHGHRDAATLAAQLARGVEPARALTDVLDLDARGVEVAVARWTREQAAADEDPTPTTGGGAAAADEATT